ncbi:MAG TPA: hypothetical protein ENJ84_10720 [Gammaproteobacteria bacterium]|nr:hypothetical protein [Gammaproteobacteria bacterium]
MKFLLILLLTILVSVSSVYADSGHHGKGEHQISREGAARIARQRFGGRILDIRPRAQDGRKDYRVKMLREGRVRVFDIDGKTGKVRH